MKRHGIAVNPRTNSDHGYYENREVKPVPAAWDNAMDPELVEPARFDDIKERARHTDPDFFSISLDIDA